MIRGDPILPTAGIPLTLREITSPSAHGCDRCGSAWYICATTLCRAGGAALPGSGMPLMPNAHGAASEEYLMRHETVETRQTVPAQSRTLGDHCLSPRPTTPCREIAKEIRGVGLVFRAWTLRPAY